MQFKLIFVIAFFLVFSPSIQAQWKVNTFVDFGKSQVYDGNYLAGSAFGNYKVKEWVLAAGFSTPIIKKSNDLSAINIETLLSDASDQNALILMVGDLCTGRVDDFDVLKRAIQAYPDVLTFPLVGNHELY